MDAQIITAPKASRMLPQATHSQQYHAAPTASSAANPHILRRILLMVIPPFLSFSFVDLPDQGWYNTAVRMQNPGLQKGGASP